MKSRIVFLGAFVIALLLSYPTHAVSQSSQFGSLTGVVSGSDGTPLPAVNVLVVGTSIGASADINGNYFIRDISSGIHKISFSYVGYDTKTLEVRIKPGVIKKLNVTLQATGVKGKEVVVTAQRAGQEAAINEQINAVNIKNVVAADRLQQNPDLNATEAIGRLPGISLIRSGGVGVGIVICGMDPSYSIVTLDGMMPLSPLKLTRRSLSEA